MILLACLSAFPSHAAQKPNIIFILADDLGYGDTGCYGATNVLTPNIDRLASQGLRFTDVHTPASVCTPTRYSLMTGQYAWRKAGTGILSGVAPLAITPGSVTLPSMLRKAGYATGGVGKWHLGLGTGTTDYNTTIRPGPLEIGFDSYFGLPATGDRVPCIYLENHGISNYNAADPLLVSYTAKVGDEPTGSERPDLLKVQPANSQHAGTIINGISRIGWMDGVVAARWVDEDMADVLTARATSFIGQHTNQPFFLYFATHDIHAPRVPHARFAGTSAHGTRGDVIQQLDWCVGQVVAKLDELNLSTNTLVIFTSDNGGVIEDGYLDVTPNNQAVSGPLRSGKYSLYEGGHRAAFIVRWPGRVPVGVSSAFMSFTDMLTTLAALVGQPLPTDAGHDSVNVLPALLGQSSVSARQNLVMQNNGSSPLAVRQGDWKYLPSNGQLYNLATDLSEATNVAAANPGRVTDLNALLNGIKNTPASGRLLAWWPMNDGSGTTVRDLSANNQPAQTVNSPAWIQQSNVTFLRFNGASQYVSATGLPVVTNRLTLACWARSATALWNASGCLISRQPGFALHPFQGSRRLGFRLTGSTGLLQTLEFDLANLPGFDLTQWHHYAASFDAVSGEARLYADGVLRTNLALTPGALMADTGPLYLGAEEGGTGGYFSGDLADARIYDDALEPQRIANAASAMLLDVDGDGMLDDWEVRQGLDPFNAADATEDPDGDGANNLAEFVRNTSPFVPDSAGGTGLISWWRFDETNGTIAADSSGAGHAGSLSNSPTWTAGPGRRYLSFNGTNQFVQVNGLSNLNSQVTAACWVRSRTTNWNFAGVMMSRRPQFVLHPWLNPAGSNRLSFIVVKPDNSTASADIELISVRGFSITNWHHYAGTYNAASGAIHLYVDGYLRAATNITPTLLQNDTGPLQIGKDDTFSRYLNGDIDEARLYDRALSAAEILDLARGFDDDQDGLPDDFERGIVEANSSDSILRIEDVRPGDDFDGDAVTNADEYIAGTDPTSAADRLRIQDFTYDGAEAHFTVGLSGRAGRIYTLERCGTLGGTWEVADESGPLATDIHLELSEMQTPTHSAFYRVRARLAP